MNLISLSQSDKQYYNHFVSTHGGSFLQSWEWGEWQASLGFGVFRFKIEDEDHDTQAVIQIIKMPLLGKWYYLYAPYGPVLSEKFKIENVKQIAAELQREFPDALFFRIEPQAEIEQLESVARKTTNIQPAITMVVDLKKSTEELLAGMHNKTRYNIKVAQKHGVEVQTELVITPQHGLYVKAAVDLILQTQARQQYRGHQEAYYKKLIDFFSIHNTHSGLRVTIYKALHERQLLASGIMIDFGMIRMYLYGGSSEEKRNFMAPYLMHWQAMCDAQALGISMYDLGGSEVSSGGEKGFTRFKQGFGGSVVTYMGAYDIIFQPFFYVLYKAMRGVNRMKIKYSK